MIHDYGQVKFSVVLVITFLSIFFTSLSVEKAYGWSGIYVNSYDYGATRRIEISSTSCEVTSPMSFTATRVLLLGANCGGATIKLNNNSPITIPNSNTIYFVDCNMIYDASSVGSPLLFWEIASNQYYYKYSSGTINTLHLTLNNCNLSTASANSSVSISCSKVDFITFYNNKYYYKCSSNSNIMVNDNGSITNLISSTKQIFIGKTKNISTEVIYFIDSTDNLKRLNPIDNSITTLHSSVTTNTIRCITEDYVILSSSSNTYNKFTFYNEQLTDITSKIGAFLIPKEECLQKTRFPSDQYMYHPPDGIITIKTHYGYVTRYHPILNQYDLNKQYLLLIGANECQTDAGSGNKCGYARFMGRAIYPYDKPMSFYYENLNLIESRGNGDLSNNINNDIPGRWYVNFVEEIGYKIRNNYFEFKNYINPQMAKNLKFINYDFDKYYYYGYTYTILQDWAYDIQMFNLTTSMKSIKWEPGLPMYIEIIQKDKFSGATKSHILAISDNPNDQEIILNPSIEFQYQDRFIMSYSIINATHGSLCLNLAQDSSSSYTTEYQYFSTQSNTWIEPLVTTSFMEGQCKTINSGSNQDNKILKVTIYEGTDEYIFRFTHTGNFDTGDPINSFMVKIKGLFDNWSPLLGFSSASYFYIIAMLIMIPLASRENLPYVMLAYACVLIASLYVYGFTILNETFFYIFIISAVVIAIWNRYN